MYFFLYFQFLHKRMNIYDLLIYFSKNQKFKLALPELTTINFQLKFNFRFHDYRGLSG